MVAVGKLLKQLGSSHFVFGAYAKVFEAAKLAQPMVLKCLKNDSYSTQIATMIQKFPDLPIFLKSLTVGPDEFINLMQQASCHCNYFDFGTCGRMFGYLLHRIFCSSGIESKECDLKT